MNRPVIAPSILSADFSDIASAIKLIEEAGAEWIHADVMDGQFVPPISFGSKMIADIRKRTRLPIDVHLMTVQPENHIDDFILAGADYITFHAEACVHAHRIIQRIREAGRHPGISIVPSTSVDSIRESLPFVDLVLVMTVNPGYGGQAMLPFCLDKVSKLKEIRSMLGLRYLVSIDGGVSLETAPLIASHAPDILVIGSAFFSAADKSDLAESMRNHCGTNPVC